MTSDTNGLQAQVREVVPMAIYSPCNAHKLDLVIANASKLAQIQNCVPAINEAYYSLYKRQRFLEKVMPMTTLAHTNITKLVGLCIKRWVERFEAFKNVLDLAEAVVTICEIIVSPHLHIHNEDF